MVGAVRNAWSAAASAATVGSARSSWYTSSTTARTADQAAASSVSYSPTSRTTSSPRWACSAVYPSLARITSMSSVPTTEPGHNGGRAQQRRQQEPGVLAEEAHTGPGPVGDAAGGGVAVHQLGEDRAAGDR